MLKRMISLLLVMALSFGMLPVAAMAEEILPEETVEILEEIEETIAPTEAEETIPPEEPEETTSSTEIPSIPEDTTEYCVHGLDAADCSVCALELEKAMSEASAAPASDTADTVTRAEWLSRLTEVFEMTVEEDNYPDNYFSDLSSDSTYYYDVLLAVEFGVVDIPAGGKVHPDDPTTREFAAQTLNFCLGYQFEGDTYTFSDADLCAYPDDAQIAVNRGWLVLIDGAFCPETAITTAEMETMLEDAAQVRDSNAIDPGMSTGYQFADDVIVFPYGADYELGDDGTVVIWSETTLVQAGDTFALYPTADFPALYKAVTVSGDGNKQIITTSEADESESVKSVNIQGNLSLDLAEFEAEEGVTASFISSEAQAASMAALYDIKVEKNSIIIDKKIKVDEGREASLVVNLSNLKLNYIFDSDVGYYYLTLSGDSTISSSASIDVVETLGIEDTIQLGQVRVYGVGVLTLSVAIGLDGSLTVNYENSFEAGVQRDWNGFRLIHSFRKKSFNCVVEANASVGLQAGLGVDVLAAHATIYAETGVSSHFTSTEYGDGQLPAVCADITAWQYAKVGAEAEFGILFSEYKWDGEQDVYTEENSPYRLAFHYEDSVQVPECTRGNSDYVTPEGSSQGTSGYGSNDTSGLFSYILDGGEAHIIGYNGYNSSIIRVPSMVDGYPVTAVGIYQHSCPDDGVHDRDTYHTPIKMIVVPEGVTTIQSLGGSNYRIPMSQLHTIVLPDSLTTLGGLGNTSLTSLTLPSNLETISQGFLNNVTTLTTLTIPKSVTQMSHALEGSNVQTLIFEDGIEALPDYCAYGAENLVSVSIPDTVTYIGHCAFMNSGLQSLTLPESLTHLGKAILDSNTGVTELFVPKGLTYYTGQYSYSCLYGSGVEYLEFEEGLTAIPEQFANGASKLTTVVFPDSVTHIDDEAFANSGLKNLTLPAKVEILGEGMLAGNTGVTQITIPKTVTTAISAFSDSAVAHILFEEGTTKIPGGLCYGGYGYSNDNSTLTEVTIPDTVTAIGNGAFRSCTALTSIDLPDGITSIEGTAFEKTGLTVLKLPAQLTTIGYNLLKETENVKELVIPKYVTSAAGALRGSSLETLEFEEGITAIPANLFASADSDPLNTTLTKVILPESVTAIGSSAFMYCSALEELEIPANVTTIGSYAFRNTALKTLTLPEGLTTLGSYFIRDVASLKEITIPKALTDGNYALNGSAIEKLTFEEGLPEIPDYFAYKVTALAEVIFPESLESVGRGAFQGCTALTEITLPSKVSTVKDAAFYGCTSLQTVWFQDDGNSLQRTVYGWSFKDCTALTKVVFEGISPWFYGTDHFSGVTATVYYPGDDATWTEEIRQDYGGSLTWVPSGHVHTYDREVADSAYLKSPATCSSKAVYYKSCECGAAGTETFGYGELSSQHAYDSDQDTTCNVCGHVRVITQLAVPAKPYKICNVVSGIHVYWKASEGADKYGLWRSETGKNGTYKWIANPSVPHFTDTKVTSGKTYWYKVTGLDTDANIHSDKSEPIGLTYVATPDITLRVNRAVGIGLGWQKIEGATGYAIYRKSYSGTDAWKRIATISGGDTLSWNDTSVKTSNGQVYRYTIRALAGSNMGTLSGCRNTGRTMVRLTSRSLTDAAKASSTSIKCTWTTSSAVTGYEVRFMVGSTVYKSVTIGNYKTGAKTFPNLKSGQTYKIQVRSYKKVDGVGSFYSAWSTAKNVTLP